MDAQSETDAPKIDGTQTHVPKTDGYAADQSLPAPARRPKATPAAGAGQDASPRKKKPGDLAMAKPPEAKPEPPAPRQRPLTLAEVRDRNKMAGERDETGRAALNAADLPGVRRAAGIGFGEYDERIIAAVQACAGMIFWTTQGVSMERTGKVVIDFRLNYDGSISEIKQVESSVSGVQEFLCEKAITDPAPFERWPIEMRRKLEADSIPVQFTFYY